MSRDITVIPFRQPEATDDHLTEVAREGARRMLAQVLIAEVDSFVALWKGLKLPDGRDRVVRHGHGPHRAIQTGVGPVEVRRAKVRDRGEVLGHRLNALAVTWTDQPRYVNRTHPTPRLVTQSLQKRPQPTLKLPPPVQYPASHGRPLQKPTTYESLQT